ncbi:GNAT family N-acetyltransferase [Dyadobacter psychrotolerans]|uniref:GNAT family N-acetyltransferase n=1 Tax=Dyadobacter psychrotolerans TaxID=2541721 RepID=A0A4R5DV24_9BACT|nr:GNAT family N-acetyltransferase [Dyadobacter psychrotolerans]TDE16364.1 GNAT family N-acetyltransferase [Dyadobacter psychrotolerans]
MKIEIRIIDADETLAIRHQVLWPDKSPDFVKVPEDESAFHFGLFADDKLVAVISLFPEGDKIRFRKFATVAAFQNRGLGSILLNYVFDFAKNEGYKKIWCDARTTALPFYERFGFSRFSDSFLKENIEYYKIEKML